MGQLYSLSKHFQRAFWVPGIVLGVPALLYVNGTSPCLPGVYRRWEGRPWASGLGPVHTAGWTPSWEASCAAVNKGKPFPFFWEEIARAA